MTEYNDSYSGRLLSRDIAKDPGTPGCLRVAAQWLKDCLETHKRCQKAIGLNPRLPTRVVDVGSREHHPHLFQTKGERGNYVALSYCWGESNTLKLTEDTLHGFTKQISLETMPKTFQDAITVVRGFKIQYVWIDALCIVQNSAEDWRRESARMNDIYSNATFTIFATDSSSAADGFLEERVTDEVALPWRRPGFGPPHGEVFARMSHERGNFYDEGDFAHSPWASRGWTLQEHLSAGRALAYTKAQMGWHCLTCVVGENGEYRDQLTAQHKPTPDNWKGLVKLQDPREDGLRIETYHAKLVRLFYFIVDNYRSRLFKFQSDKLPATAGLAKVLEAKLKGRDRYWAGLWEGYIAEGLTWSARNMGLSPRVDYGRTLRESGDIPVCVPSWSWASVIRCNYAFEGVLENVVFRTHWRADELLPALVLKTLYHPMRRILRRLLREYQVLGTISGAANIGQGSLLKDIRLPNVADEERFIPTKPLEMTLTAPFQRLSDTWRDSDNPVDESYPGLSAFEAVTRHLQCSGQDNKEKGEGGEKSSDEWEDRKIGGEGEEEKQKTNESKKNFPREHAKPFRQNSEFTQKHRHYNGQHFAAIQVYKWMKLKRDDISLKIHLYETTHFLILESVVTGYGNIQRYRRVGDLVLGKGDDFGLIYEHDRDGVIKWKGRAVHLGDIMDMLNERPWREEEIVLI